MITRRLFVAALLSLASLSPQAFAAGFSSDRISVTVVGSGSDVVLVHGLGSSPRVWAEMMKAVPGYRYHLVHMAGMGGKDKGANGDGPVAAPVAEEIARYIASEKLNKPAVIGHSMGGTISMMLAARHPDAVSKVMVVDMLPWVGVMFGPPGTTPASVKPTADAIMARQKGDDAATRSTRVQASITAMINNAPMRAGAIEDALKSDQNESANSLNELITTDLQQEMANIKVPATVLFVVPAGIPLTPEQLSGVYHYQFSKLAGVRIQHVPNAAHFIMWDQPEVFQKEVAAFLKTGSADKAKPAKPAEAPAPAY